MDTIARNLGATYPASNRDVGVEVVPLLEETVDVVRPALYLAFGAVSCLLLISCLNLANLLSARAASRNREYAVRLALGASRGRLALQAFTEIAPVLVAGGVLGSACAAWGVAAFLPLAPPTLPRVENIEIDGPVLAFSQGLLLITGIIAGLLPARQAWSSDLAGATRDNGRSNVGGRQQSLARNCLVVAQIALVLPLLVGAGLLARSFSALVQVDPGFRADNVLSLQLAIARSKYRTDEQVASFCTLLTQRVAALPGVASVGMVNRLPLSGTIQTLLVTFDDWNTAQPAMDVDSRTITPDYFRTMGIPLIEGRVFTDHDTDTLPLPGFPNASFPMVGIIDERIARTLWPGRSALGKRFRLPFADAPWAEIVGVVGHIHHDGLDVDSRPQIYFNYLQRPQDRMALVVRGREDARALAVPIVEAIRSVDSEQPVYDVRTLNEVVNRTTAQRWLNATLVTAFALLALLLASVGLYGVIIYGVTRQTREFGVRLALGAQRSDITRLVLSRGVKLAAGGTVIGLAATLVTVKAIESLLYGIQPFDPSSFLAAAALLVVVALLASYMPARRAASTDPAVALRCE
jgi:putative ABC transport system permease protein